MLANAAAIFELEKPALLAAAINALRTHAQPPRGRPAHTTGSTERALRPDAGPDFVALYGPAHIQTLLTGRGPTRSNAPGTEGQRLSDILAQWAEDKGIQLTGGMSFKTFGFLAARKMHREGSELFREAQPSGLLDKVLSKEYLDTLKARLAAGEMVAITTALRSVLGN